MMFHIPLHLPVNSLFLLQSLPIGIIAYGRRENDALSRCLSIIWIIAVTLTLGIMPLLDNWATAAGMCLKNQNIGAGLP